MDIFTWRRKCIVKFWFKIKYSEINFKWACSGWLWREGPPVGGRLVDWLPHHRDPPPPLLISTHIFSWGELSLLLLLSTHYNQRLPKTNTDANKENEEVEVSFKDTWQQYKDLFQGLKGNKKMDRDAFLPALKRLLTNKLYICNFFSTIFFVFAFMGFGTFMPK